MLARILHSRVMKRLLNSLRNRIFFAFLLSAVIPLTLIGILSYVSITSILDNKIQQSVRSNLRQVQISLENTLANLNHVSQQLALNGMVGSDLVKYLETEDFFYKDQLETAIRQNVNMIRFSNPNLGPMYYYFEDTLSFVLKEPMAGHVAVSELPVLLQTDEMIYSGPHPTTMSRFIDRTVLSVTREVDLPQYDKMRVYIETSFQLTEKVLNADQSSMKIAYLFVDPGNRISYSENPQQFPIGSTYAPQRIDSGLLRSGDTFLFEEHHNQGWKLVAAIPEADFYSEKKSWLRQFIWYTLLSVFTALLIAWMIWKMVRMPLGRFNTEIKRMHNGNFHLPLKMTNINEFDFVLEQFQTMKEQNRGLLEEVKEKEQRKAEMEIEKLLFQINPHFIHNTLDTIRWLARSKGMTEIDHLIASLNRVLYYNMGKGGTSTIRAEIKTLSDYMELQRIRYDTDFTVSMDVDEEVLDWTIPRFILQPLVENSLYHGLKDDGVIEVIIACTVDDIIFIQVIDNGMGMKPEVIEKLMYNQTREQRKVGMGIGLYYVHRVLKARFGDAAQFEISSKPGEGTIISLWLPAVQDDDREEQTNHAESVGRG